MIRNFFIFILLFSFEGYSELSLIDYPHIDKEVWENVRPYLLSKKIRIKKKLDSLFIKLNKNFSEENLKNNGFVFCTDHHLHIHALKHKLLKGYVIKLIPEWDKRTHDWEQFISRIKGAKVIKKGIKQLGYENMMIVPKKWIYPFPKECINQERDPPIYFALIATDMNILDVSQNHKEYRTKTNFRHLEAIFNMATIFGLADSCKAANLSWTMNGQLAFVDTEVYHQWPVNYHLLNEFLSKINREFWKRIITSYKNKYSDIN